MPFPTAHVLAQLELLAPLSLAESWDNVGLLLAPGRPAELARAFLTIDLTEDTLEEAVESGAELIIAYHPPIFAGLKRLRADVPAERVILRAVQRGLLIYSPHTALDAAAEGMADWLAECLGPGTRAPIAPASVDPAWGAGRRVELSAPIALSDAVERIKAHLGLPVVRLSAPRSQGLVRSLAVCPGAGGSLFEQVGDVDLLLTGEMRHHDVLARRARGTAVILTDHTHTERAYLPRFARRLAAACPGLEVVVSERDDDPLVVC